MDLQTVTSTDVQRSFGKFLDNLTEPVIIIRDSRPAAVIQPIDEYLHIEELKKQALKNELFEMMEDRSGKTKKYSNREIDRDIAEALNAVRRRRR